MRLCIACQFIFELFFRWAKRNPHIAGYLFGFYVNLFFTYLFYTDINYFS